MTTVHPIHPFDSSEADTGLFQDDKNYVLQPFKIKKEIQTHTVQSEKRKQVFHNVILNISTSRRSKQHILIGFMGLWGSLLSTKPPGQS